MVWLSSSFFWYIWILLLQLVVVLDSVLYQNLPGLGFLPMLFVFCLFSSYSFPFSYLVSKWNLDVILGEGEFFLWFRLLTEINQRSYVLRYIFRSSTGIPQIWLLVASCIAKLEGLSGRPSVRAFVLQDASICPPGLLTAKFERVLIGIFAEVFGTMKVCVSTYFLFNEHQSAPSFMKWNCLGQFSRLASFQANLFSI